MSANKTRGWVKRWVVDDIQSKATHTPTGLVVRGIGSRLSIDADTLDKAQAAIAAESGTEHLAAEVRRLVDQAGQLLTQARKSRTVKVMVTADPPAGAAVVMRHIPVGLHLPDEDAS